MNSRIVMYMSLLIALIGHRPINTDLWRVSPALSLDPLKVSEQSILAPFLLSVSLQKPQKTPQTFTCMHILVIAPSPFYQNRAKCLILSIHKLHKFYDIYHINPFPLYKFSLSCFFAIILSVPVFCCQGSYILKHETFRKRSIVFRQMFTLVSCSLQARRPGINA